MRKIVIFSALFLSLFILNCQKVDAVGPVTSAPSAPFTNKEVNQQTQTGQQDRIVTLPNPLPFDSLGELIGAIIRSMLGLAGSAALVMFVYGGFTWVLSAGNSESMQRGKNILIWAVVGLIVVFSSYAILRTLLGGFVK